MTGMELRVFTEPQQGASYDDLLRVAQTTEELGFGAFFRSDHFLGHGHRRPARPDGLVGDARRAGAGDEHHPARHPGHQRDVPLARPAGDPGRPGRPDERRAGRARHRRGLVREGARGVRLLVPRRPRALRHARGPAGDRHRPVGDRGRLLVRRQAALRHRLARPAQAAPDQAADHHGRRRQAAFGGVGGQVRRRVQPGLQGRSRTGSPSSSASSGPARRPGATRRR